MFLFLLHLSACVAIPRIPFLVGAAVSHRDPFSIAVSIVGFYNFNDMLLLLLVYFVRHRSYPSSIPGLHVFWGCQYVLANDCHILPLSGLLPDLRVQHVLVFHCHPFIVLFLFQT